MANDVGVRRIHIILQLYKHDRPTNNNFGHTPPLRQLLHVFVESCRLTWPAEGGEDRYFPERKKHTYLSAPFASLFKLKNDRVQVPGRNMEEEAK